MEALVNVRAAGALADGVQVQPAQVGLQMRDGLKMGLAFAQPFGQTRTRFGDLNQVGQYFRLHLAREDAFEAGGTQVIHGLGLFSAGLHRADEDAVQVRFAFHTGDHGVKALLGENF